MIFYYSEKFFIILYYLIPLLYCNGLLWTLPQNFCIAISYKQFRYFRSTLTKNFSNSIYKRTKNSTLVIDILICYIVNYNSILYYTIQYYIILYYTILYYTMPYYTITNYHILYYTITHYHILYYTIPYYRDRKSVV